MYYPLRPILLVTGFYFYYTFFYIGILVDGGLSTEFVCLDGWLFLFNWLGMGGFATELALVVFLAKKVETGSYVELYYF